jgi:hypothetical protein
MSSYFKLGQFVKVASDNDNDCYDSFREKTLKIVKVSENTKDHPGYDEGMRGMPLYDLVAIDGTEINCSLYAYELQRA